MDVVRLIMALLLFTAASAEDDDCQMCFDNVCYGPKPKYLNHHFLPIKSTPEPAIDRVENLIYFVYSGSLDIKAMNLTDDTMKTVVQLNETVLGLAVNETSRDLYYSLENGNFFKHNLVTHQTDSILKPITSERQRIRRVRLGRLLVASGKLYGISTGPMGPSLYEYIPEKMKFQLFSPTKNVSFFYKPTVDKRGDMYFKYLWNVHKLPADNNTTVVFHDDRVSHEIGNIEEITTDKDGVAHFMPGAHPKLLYRLDYDTNEMVLVGAIRNGYLNSLLFDKYNNPIYKFIGLRFLIANTDKCELKHHNDFISYYEIVKLPKHYK